MKQNLLLLAFKLMYFNLNIGHRFSWGGVGGFSSTSPEMINAKYPPPHPSLKFLKYLFYHLLNYLFVQFNFKAMRKMQVCSSCDKFNQNIYFFLNKNQFSAEKNL